MFSIMLPVEHLFHFVNSANSWLPSSLAFSHNLGINLLAQVEPISQQQFMDILAESDQQANSLTNEWAAQWSCIFTLSLVCTAVGKTPTFLFPMLSQFGIIAAVGTLLFFMIQYMRDLNDGNMTRSIPELIWPFVVALLLSPGLVISLSFGTPNLGVLGVPTSNVPTLTLPTLDIQVSYNNLARITLQMYQALEETNALIQTFPLVVDSYPINMLQKQANAITNATSIIQGYIKPCMTSPGGGGAPKDPLSPTIEELLAQRSCASRMVEQSLNLLSAYDAKYFQVPPATVATATGEPACLKSSNPWIAARCSELNSILFLTDIVGASLQEAAGQAFWLLGPDSRAGGQNLALSFQLGFKQMLDAAMLFTGLLGPIAVGASLLPVPAANKMITSWLTGFLAIGMAKIFYNIITGIASAVMLRADPPVVDPTWFTTFLSYVAPALALGLATGGGTALWSGLQSGVSPLLSK
jgi:hypothetical protein